MGIKKEIQDIRDNSFQPDGPWSVGNKVVELSGGWLWKMGPTSCEPTDEDVSDLSEEKIKQNLLEQFTTELKPPEISAAMFMVMDLHPSYGLKMAYAWQKEESNMWNKDNQEAINECVEKFIGRLLKVLETYDTISEASEKLNESTSSIRTTISVRGLEFASQSNTEEFIRDFFEIVLGPAQIGRYDHQGNIEIPNKKILKNAKVGN